MVNTDDVVAKSSNSDKSFFTSETRKTDYTTVNTVDVVVKSLNMDKSFLTFPTKAAKYTTVYTDKGRGKKKTRII